MSDQIGTLTITELEPHPAQSACERLEELLDNLEKVSAELEEYKERATEASENEEQAIINEDLSESQAVKLIGDSQKLRAVFLARAARRELAVAELVTGLEETRTLAEREFTGMVNEEVSKRSAFVKDQVLRILDIEGNPDVLLRSELTTILKHSRSVRVISALRPAGFYSNPGSNVEYAVQAARLLLQNLKTFQEYGCAGDKVTKDT